MAVPQALTLFHSPCSRQYLHKRISKRKNSLKPPNDEMMREIDALHSGAVPVPLKTLALQEKEIILTPAHYLRQLPLQQQPVEVVTHALPANDEAAIKLIVDDFASKDCIECQAKGIRHAEELYKVACGDCQRIDVGDGDAGYGGGV